MLDSACWHTIRGGPNTSLSWSNASQLSGRVIGFDLRMGDSNPWFGWGYQKYGRWMEHVSALRVITNSCSCPASYFKPESVDSISSMTVQIGNGTPETQVINYADNQIELLYGQDCGSYSVKFEPVNTGCDLSAALSVDDRFQIAGRNNHPYS